MLNNNDREAATAALRIIQLRNGIFQGSLASSNNQGTIRSSTATGLMLDNEFTLTASEWTHGRIQGNFWAVFRDTTVIYGTVGTATSPSKQPIINEDQKRLKFEAINPQTVLTMNNEKWIVYLSGRRVVAEPRGSGKRYICVIKSEGLQIEKEAPQDEPLEAVWNYLISPSSPPNEEAGRNQRQPTASDGILKDWPEFIEANLGKKLPLVIRKTKGLKTISFMNSSLYSSFSSDSQVRGLATGYYHQQESRNHLLLRVEGGVVREIVRLASQDLCTEFMQTSTRPAQCATRISSYFKLGLSFKDDFLSVKTIYDIKADCMTIIEQLQNALVVIVAQKTMSNTDVNDSQVPLGEVKNRIYAAAERNRSKSRRTGTMSQFGQRGPLEETPPKSISPKGIRANGFIAGGKASPIRQIMKTKDTATNREQFDSRVSQTNSSNKRGTTAFSINPRYKYTLDHENVVESRIKYDQSRNKVKHQLNTPDRKIRYTNTSPFREAQQSGRESLQYLAATYQQLGQEIRHRQGVSVGKGNKQGGTVRSFKYI